MLHIPKTLRIQIENFAETQLNEYIELDKHQIHQSQLKCLSDI